MRLLLLLIINLMILMDGTAQFAGKRQVIVFGELQSPSVQQQLKLLQQAAPGVADRDMEIIQAAGKQHYHQRYKVHPADAFVLVLVGKDGGEKYRTSQPVPAATLFDIIDAMPMRQQEMRRKKQ